MASGTVFSMHTAAPPNRFRELRERAGVTLEQIGRACDVYGSTACRWQDAPHLPPQHLSTIACLLGVTVAQLAGWEPIAEDVAA
jgi:transcriptional regulator with XRE-family HTH domain